MSGLAAVLAGRKPPGIYRWHTALGLAPIEHAVEHTDWTLVVLDTCRIDDLAGFVETVRRTPGFDQASGDGIALWESALNVVPADERTLLLWDGWSPLARTDREAFDAVVLALQKRVESSGDGAFVALLKGDGPDVELPELDPHIHM